MSRVERFGPLQVPLAGVRLVTASAGTGKTFAITTLYVRLLLELELDVDQILVVTFTEAATAELRSRIRGRLQTALRAFDGLAAGEPCGDADLDAYAAQRRSSAAADRQRLRTAIRNVDEAAISTIHGFCHRMLHQSAFESGVLFEAELLTDLTPLQDELVYDFWANATSAAPAETVRRIEAAGLQPSGCHGLASQALRARDATVIPEHPVDHFAVAVEQAQALWAPEEIGARIHGHPALGRKRAGTVERWLRTAEEFLAEPPARAPARETALPVGIRRLSSSELRQACQDDAPPPTHPFFAAADRIVAAVKHDRDRGPEVVGFRKALVDYVRSEMPLRKERAGAMSFDDLLYLLRDALAGPTGARLAEVIRSHYRAALIDEFQDTDPVQYAIFRAVYGGTELPLYLIGDPKQAIYAFRGADIFAFLSALGSTASQRYTMGVNWRSDPALVAAVGEVFRPDEQQPRPFLLDGIDVPPVEPRRGATDAFCGRGAFAAGALEFLFVPRSDEVPNKTRLKELLPDRIAAEIVELLRSGSTIAGEPLQPSHVAVLTRSNDQAFAVQQALRRLDVPAVVLGDRSVFSSPEAEQLGRVLAAVAEPQSAHAARRALCTELLGVRANELAALEAEPAAWDRWGALLREAHRRWIERGFVPMFRTLMAQSDLQTRLLRLADGERRLTNVLHLMELLHTASTEAHLGPVGLLRWLAEQRQGARTAAEQSEIRLESDDAAVRISTVHKAKGLEYDVVYCPYLWDGKLLHREDERALRFHDDDGHLVIDLGSLDFDEHRARAELYEALAEGLRLLYVALTRAKHRCSVVFSPVGSETSALSYLLHPPAPEPGEALRIDHVRDPRRKAALTNEAILAALERLARRSDGAIAVRSLAMDVQPEPRPRPAVRAADLSHRRVSRPIESWWRIASYTTLASSGTDDSADPDEGRDREELLVELELPTGLVVPTPEPSLAEPVVLADSFRGPRAGNVVHEVLEHLDFGDFAALEPLVRQGLTNHGFAADGAANVTAAIEQVLATPLVTGDEAFTLGDVPSERRLNELEFYLPVASAATGPAARAATAAALERVFDRHRRAPVPPGYGARLGRLSFAGLHGFLLGYVDLVLEHRGRFYVVDYKTNYLGPTLGDYGQRALTEAMAHGHYFLQYHLYCLAVHRYLHRRVPRYDYDRHFGGALYLFVRGMSPRTGPELGVFHDRPSRAMLQGLSAVLDGRAEEDAS